MSYRQCISRDKCNMVTTQNFKIKIYLLFLCLMVNNFKGEGGKILLKLQKLYRQEIDITSSQSKSKKLGLYQ